MSEKRKDSKGRILRNGESQRSDGMYMYRYTDLQGKRRSVYSWKLVDTDKTPTGKKITDSLRNIEKQIQKDLDDDVDSKKSENVTLNFMFNTFMDKRLDLKTSTRCNYLLNYNKYVRDTIGNKKIKKISSIDIQGLYGNIVKEYGLEPCSVTTLHILINQLFLQAVELNIIKKNPASGAWKAFKKVYDAEPNKRHALTVGEQEEFVNFVYSAPRFKHWRTLCTFLLGTGARIGEALGLQWDDCDFKNGTIYIKRSLLYGVKEGGKGFEFRISSPKTKSGIRMIPMFDDVKEALIEWRSYVELQNYPEYNLEGLSNFVFVNKHGTPTCGEYVDRVLKQIVSMYNEQELAKAEQDGRKPKRLPKICAHMLRHTFCTRMCEQCGSVADIKVIQEILGHRSFQTTMDIYDEATRDLKKSNFAKINNKIKLR